jgi:methylated-DNA-[protein]-cysteine S-methyltransferase
MTLFQQIYQEVRKVPCGQTATYGEVASRVGTTPQVVGWALHRNPDPQDIPCHRVVFKNYRLGLTPSAVSRRKEPSTNRRALHEGTIV